MNDITAATIAALATIDAELGMSEDGCNSTARTLTAIRLLHSVHLDDVAEVARLERELAAARAEIDGPRNRCPQCDHLRLELGEARAEAEALRHDMERQADTLAELATENEALRKALAMMYDKWVDGDDCYEEPDTFSAFLGKAFQLSITEEDHVISLLGKDCPTRAIDAAIAKEQKP